MMKKNKKVQKNKKNIKKLLTKYKITVIIYTCQEELCRCSSMVEPQPSKLMTRVRFPLPAPDFFYLYDRP